MLKLTLSKTLVWLGIALILITGLIHLVEAPENYQEVAYKGVLFYLNGAGALLAAIGIYRGQRSWGWTLGGLIAFGSIVGYIISRTIGLPLMEVDDEWLEPLGVASLLAEAIYMGLYLYVLSRPLQVVPPTITSAPRSQSAPSR
jgi:hypothetical protein